MAQEASAIASRSTKPFVEVSTDKVNAEVPSPVSGVIRELLVKEGETVATGTPIAVIDEVASAAAAPADAPAAATKAEANRMAERRARAGLCAAFATVEPARRGAECRHARRAHCARRSPAVRRLAREHRVDIRARGGTGANGRVTAEDVLAAARGAVARPSHPSPSAAAAPAPATRNLDLRASRFPVRSIPLNQARRIIAERMVESKQTAPHAWSMVEIDVTNVWKWRVREKDRFERETGYKLTLLPFFIRAVVAVARRRSR